MYLCYIDESGTPDLPGNTSHFVLVGIAIPIDAWKRYERDIEAVKKRFGLEGQEIHTGWILRSHREQSLIPNFDNLDRDARRAAVLRERNAELLAVQKAHKQAQYRQKQKNFDKTEPYVHLSRVERIAFVEQVAQVIASWDKARLFAECIDKVYFDPIKAKRTIGEQAFEQIVSRFEQFLKNESKNKEIEYGLLIHDNNDTVARRHTEMMRQFHERGTFWVSITHIMETPLFVDSELTGMIQIADVCGYALRRYLENGERNLFDLVFSRGDRRPNGVCVGIRHFASSTCACEICAKHRLEAASGDKSCE